MSRTLLLLLVLLQDQTAADLARAIPIEGHPTIEHFKAVAKELGVVLPVSVYERANQVRRRPCTSLPPISASQALFNTVAMIDSDGTLLGIYRKSHIPDGPGYTEKYYFSPGDTGFKVWSTKVW